MSNGQPCTAQVSILSLSFADFIPVLCGHFLEAAAPAGEIPHLGFFVFWVDAHPQQSFCGFAQASADPAFAPARRDLTAAAAAIAGAGSPTSFAVQAAGRPRHRAGRCPLCTPVNRNKIEVS